MESLSFEKKSLFLVVAIAAVIAGLYFLRSDLFSILTRPGESPPPADQAPPAPPAPLERIISGNVLRISQADRTMTVGTYHVENNKAVLASQQTISFTAETIFVRQAPTAANPFAEAVITSKDVKEGDIVHITPAGAGDTDPLVAKKVTRLALPPPPSPQ